MTKNLETIENILANFCVKLEEINNTLGEIRFNLSKMNEISALTLEINLFISYNKRELEWEPYRKFLDKVEKL